MGIGHDLLAIASVAGRVCIGLVFALAATQKMLHWRLLSGVIANYRLLPRASVGLAAALLPPLEMMVGVLLLLAIGGPWPVLASILLLALFAAAMAINLRRGRAFIDCGCGQSFLKQTLRWSLVARNGALAALMLPSLAATGPMTLSATLTGAGAGLAFFLLYLLLNTISALPPIHSHTHRFA